MEQIDVEKVVQVDGPDRANEKLALGWNLLAIVPAINGTGQPYVAYVMGKPRPHEKTLEDLGRELG